MLNTTQTLPEYTLKTRFHWFFAIKKNILIKCGLINTWDIQLFVNPKWLKLTVKRKLKDLFLTKWYSQINNSSKSQFYKYFKTSFGYENYLHST